jgi:hypothetical protein
MCDLCCVEWMFMNPSALILSYWYCVSSDRKAKKEIKELLFQIFILAVSVTSLQNTALLTLIKTHQIITPSLYYALSL